MRITLIDDNSGFFLPQRVAARLRLWKKTIPLFDGEVVDTGYAVARNFSLPSLNATDGVLEIDVYFDGQRRRIEKKVKLAPRYPAGKLVYPSDTKSDVVVAKAMVGNTIMRVFPEGRGAPAGLTSLLFVQTSNENEQPVSAPYRFELPVFKKGESPKEISGQTDMFGLDAFVIRPTDLHYPMKVLNVADRGDSGLAADANSNPPPKGPDIPLSTPSKGAGGISDADSIETDSESDVAVTPTTLTPPVVYSGMKMDMQSPLIDADKPIILSLQQISGGEPVYLDIFKGAQWLYSETDWVGDDGRAQFDVSPPASGILRIQITSSPLQFTRNVIVRHVYVKKAGEDDLAALKQIVAAQKNNGQKKWLTHAVQQLASEKDGGRVSLLAAFALSRLYKGHNNLPLLVSSRKEDDAALNTFKKNFQTGLMVAILLLGAAVAILIAVIAVQSSRKQRQLTQMILDDADDIDEIADESDEDTKTTVSNRLSASRVTGWIQIGTLFLVILAAFAAIALLVLTMSWNQMPGM
ncbi:MAG: hypothetical protein JXR76_04075 [Deltaproteobacteria bacterium]|nr:hypothetical protein [Deltaproteobacteria bacterium]